MDEKPEKTVKEIRRNLAAELGELTFERAVLTKKLNENAKRSNEIGTAMEALK